jgi:hypothetical protein
MQATISNPFIPPLTAHTGKNKDDLVLYLPLVLELCPHELWQWFEGLQVVVFCIC